MQRTPFWLNNHEIQSIEQALGKHQSIKKLSGAQQQKVEALLFSMTYADKWALRRSSWFAKWFFRKATTQILAPKRNTLAARKIKQIQEGHGLPQVIDRLVSEIQLDKPPSAIFAKFHAPQPEPEKPLKKFFRFFKKPEDVSLYVQDGLEAYHYVVND